MKKTAIQVNIYFVNIFIEILGTDFVLTANRFLKTNFLITAKTIKRVTMS